MIVNMKQVLMKILERVVGVYVQENGGDGSVVIPIVLEVPQQRHHGDLSCNVAMKLAGILKKSSLEIAEAIVKVLRNESALKRIFQD